MDLKYSQGWTNAMTPPSGFTIDSATGFATPSNAIISAIRTANISQVGHNTQATLASSNMPPSFIQIPPPPPPVLPPPPINPPVANPANNNEAGANFGRQGSRQRDNASVMSVVSINGQQYNGNVYDRNGNILN
jgi:hypothetical protein